MSAGGLGPDVIQLADINAARKRAADREMQPAVPLRAAGSCWQWRDVAITFVLCARKT